MIRRFGPTMVMGLPGVVLERFRHPVIMAVFVFMPPIAMPVTVRVDMCGLSVIDQTAKKMQRAAAPEHQHDKQNGSGPNPTHDH
jgi:hypothetical protein